MSLLKNGDKEWGHAAHPHQHNKQTQEHLLCAKHDSEIFAYHILYPQNNWDMSLQSFFLKIKKLELDNLHNDPKVSYQPRIQTQ